MLNQLSCLLDDHPQLLEMLSADLIDKSRQQTGCCGLSVESVFRCLLLKQILNISYEKLAFHLSDSITYRTFTRLSANQFPSRAGLQSAIRKIGPETLQQINEWLCVQWQQQGIIDCKQLRIDSTVVEANIAFAVFYAKEPEKQALYPKLLSCAYLALKQVDRAISKLELTTKDHDAAAQWLTIAHHYRELLCRVVHQTQQRVYENTPPRNAIRT